MGMFFKKHIESTRLGTAQSKAIVLLEDRRYIEPIAFPKAKEQENNSP